MKKLLATCMLVVLAVQVAVADDVVTKDINKLPIAAREMIKKYFPEVNISYIKIDKEFLQSTNYEAVLTNGFEIDFDSKGEWKEVDCKRTAVPAALVPDFIKRYVAENFPQERIVKIERERKGYKWYTAELSNGLDAEFDRNGNFLRLDD